MLELLDPQRAAHSVPLERADIFQLRTASDGTFSITCGRGRYLIVPRDQEWAAEPTLVDTSQGNVDNLRIEVIPGTTVALSLELDPDQDYRCRIRDGHRRTIRTDWLSGRHRLTVCLLPGPYTIEIDQDGEQVVEQSFLVGSKPVTVTLAR